MSREMNFSIAEILALPATRYTDAEKKAYIDLHCGGVRYMSEAEMHTLNPAVFTGAEKKELLTRHRWLRYLGAAPNQGRPYGVAHRDVLRYAQRHAPEAPGNDVSDFSDWIYKLQPEKRRYFRLWEGLRAEQAVSASRKRAWIPHNAQWQLLPCSLDSNGGQLYPTSLEVNGFPLCGRPDIVFLEKGGRRLVIVEVKTTDSQIPSDGWPNLRAQLWAYAHIKRFRDIPDVLLVGEIWDRSGVYLRQTIRWRGDDEEFDRQNRELFDVYRGHAKTSAVPSTLP